MSIRSILLVATLSLSGVGAGVSAAAADGIKPIQAQSINLGGISGNAYYTVERDGFRVVTTLTQGEGTPIRMVATLASGQSVVLSTVSDAGVEPIEVEIAREADVVLVRKAALAY